MIAGLLAQEAAEDGVISGNVDLADIFFLIAVIVFAIAFVLRVMIRPVPLDAVMIAAGLTCLALGALVL
jgi:hypothetical protein